MTSGEARMTNDDRRLAWVPSQRGHVTPGNANLPMPAFAGTRRKTE